MKLAVVAGSNIGACGSQGSAVILEFVLNRRESFTVTLFTRVLQSIKTGTKKCSSIYRRQSALHVPHE
jgi:hypothetical protein